jgi:hypothetical protein
LSPDDKRPEPEARVELSSNEPKADEPESRAAEEAGDDLESLAAGFSPPSNEALASDSEDDADLGALATVGGQREPGLDEDDTRLDLGHLVSAARPSPPTASALGSPSGSQGRIDREPPTSLGPPSAPLMQAASLAPAGRPRGPSWVGPLMVGLAVGLGLGVVGALHRPSPNPPASLPDGASPSLPGKPVGADDSERGAIAEPVPAQPAAGPEQNRAADPPPVARPLVPPAAATHVPERVLTSTSAAPVQGSVERKLLQPRSSTSAPPPAATPAIDPPQVLSVRPAQGEPLAALAPSDAEKAPSPVANAKPASSPSVDALLDEALSPTARSAALQQERELALEQTQLPPTPTRDDVTQAMTVLLPAIRGCAMGHSGLATAGIVVRADGRVAGVEIAGAPFAGTASGRCMEGVIRRAHFPRFKQPTFRIRFPLAIQ